MPRLKLISRWVDDSPIGAGAVNGSPGATSPGLIRKARFGGGTPPGAFAQAILRAVDLDQVLLESM